MDNHSSMKLKHKTSLEKGTQAPSKNRMNSLIATKSVFEKNPINTLAIKEEVKRIHSFSHPEEQENPGDSKTIKQKNEKTKFFPRGDYANKVETGYIKPANRRFPQRKPNSSKHLSSFQTKGSGSNPDYSPRTSGAHRNSTSNFYMYYFSNAPSMRNSPRNSVARQSFAASECCLESNFNPISMKEIFTKKTLKQSDLEKLTEGLNPLKSEDRAISRQISQKSLHEREREWEGDLERDRDRETQQETQKEEEEEEVGNSSGRSSRERSLDNEKIKTEEALKRREKTQNDIDGPSEHEEKKLRNKFKNTSRNLKSGRRMSTLLPGFQDSQLSSKFNKDAGKQKISRLRNQMILNQFVILPDDPWKRAWDWLITLFLILTAVVGPYRLAFFDYDDLQWLIFDYIVDFLFAMDIGIAFFTAFYDRQDNLVINRKTIACTYLKTWFILDTIAVLPFSLIIHSSRNYNDLARIARLPRLYRVIKMAKLANLTLVIYFRLMRMLKIMRKQKKIEQYMKERLKMSSSVERLIYFAAIFFLLCHITACLFYLIAKLEDFGPKTWVVRLGFLDDFHPDVYIAALYWTIQTITTVGYGDISTHTTSERILAIIVMCIGVCAYSFAVGSLSSVFTYLDSKQAKLKERMDILEDIRYEFNLDNEMYIKLKKSLRYDYKRNTTDKYNFLSELPQSLKIELSIIMHHEVVSRIPFFLDKSPQFLAMAGPLLRPTRVAAGEFIYVEGDTMNEVFFLSRGKAAFVLKEYDDMPYIHIDEGLYFGETEFFAEDASKRLFTVKALEDCELLILHKKDLQALDQEFGNIIPELLKNAESRLRKINQFKNQATSFAFSHQAQTIKRIDTENTMDGMGNGGEALRRGKLTFHNTLREIDEFEEINSLYTSFVSDIEEEQDKDDSSSQNSNSLSSSASDSGGLGTGEANGNSNNTPKTKGEERKSVIDDTVSENSKWAKVKERVFGTLSLSPRKLEVDKTKDIVKMVHSEFENSMKKIIENALKERKSIDIDPRSLQEAVGQNDLNSSFERMKMRRGSFQPPTLRKSTFFQVRQSSSNDQLFNQNKKQIEERFNAYTETLEIPKNRTNRKIFQNQKITNVFVNPKRQFSINSIVSPIVSGDESEVH